MLTRTLVVVSVLALVMTGLMIGQAMSQEAAAPKATVTVTASAAKVAVTASAAATPSAGGFMGKMDPEAVKQMAEKMRTGMYDGLKKQLGTPDDEWKVLQPLIEKVVNLSMQVRVNSTGIASMLMGGGGGGGRRGMGGFMTGLFGGGTEPTAIDTANENLQKVLDNKESTKEDLRAALSTLREARAKARVELEAAQKELRELLSVRQEAQLVSMGILD
jgi:hypothetical protein